jgi:hypothetical protein
VASTREVTARVSVIATGQAGGPSTGVWTDERVTAQEQLDDDEDESNRTLDEYIADLDVAILALVEDLDAPVEQLADRLDEILKSSLWKRSLVRLDRTDFQKMEQEVIVSRARWLWTNTTTEQRRACFASGLGQRAGTFVHRNLDVLVDGLAQLQAAIATGTAPRVAELAIWFAEAMAHESFFSVRKLPDNWKNALTKWVSGVAFADILKGLRARQEQRTQAFIQDGVVFKLVWAAEAVRVQAITSAHARAEELGDGPMFSLTHGVPSIPAALLCQAG